MSILEALWESDVCTNEQAGEREFRLAMQKYEREKEKLLAGLSPEVQDIFHKLFNRQIEPSAIAERNAFVCGFRVAMKMIAESLGVQ